MTMQLSYITFLKFTTFSVASIWKTMLSPAHELHQEMFCHPNQSPIGIHKTNYIGQWEKPAIAQDIVAHVMSPAGLIFIICEQIDSVIEQVNFQNFDFACAPFLAPEVPHSKILILAALHMFYTSWSLR